MTGYGLRLAAALTAAALSMSACDEDETPPPEARELTRDAIGHYCNMIVADHDGPKGQIFLKSREHPLWFSSVRDTIAFTMLPEEPKDIAAIYVTDVARTDWDRPQPGTWVEARGAWYVVESSRAGGMGAPEAAPFSDRAAADAFAAVHGGRVVVFDDIPEAFILDYADMRDNDGAEHETDGTSHGH